MYDPDNEKQAMVVASLTEMMGNRDLEAKDRIRAAELLGIILEMVPEEL